MWLLGLALRPGTSDLLWCVLEKDAWVQLSGLGAVWAKPGRTKLHSKDQPRAGCWAGWVDGADVCRGERLPCIHSPAGFGGFPLSLDSLMFPGWLSGSCGFLVWLRPAGSLSSFHWDGCTALRKRAIQSTVDLNWWPTHLPAVWTTQDPFWFLSPAWQLCRWRRFKTCFAVLFSLALYFC